MRMPSANAGRHRTKSHLPWFAFWERISTYRLRRWVNLRRLRLDQHGGAVAESWKYAKHVERAIVRQASIEHCLKLQKTKLVTKAGRRSWKGSKWTPPCNRWGFALGATCLSRLLEQRKQTLKLQLTLHMCGMILGIRTKKWFRGLLSWTLQSHPM